MTQPEEMKTKDYVYGVERLNGYDAWSLFEASAGGDLAKAKALLAKDPRLVNAQHWYQFPIHFAVRSGHARIVKLLLQSGADPGQSRFTYDSWDKLLNAARLRGRDQIAALLQQAMAKRFNYRPEFDALKGAIVARNPKAIGSVLRRDPTLAVASDALGNNPLHWAVITRQLDLIERFVKLGTPIDAQRADGQSPLLLVANGATDYWHRDTRGSSHPSLRNTWVLAGSLLAQGADYTISVAAAAGDQEQVERLLRHDAGLATRLDSARVSPLSYAAREGHFHIVQLLLEHGADPNAPEDSAPEGRALFEACCGNHLEIARLLLQRGANPNAGFDSCGCCLTIGDVYHGKQARPLQELLRKFGAYTPPYAMSAAELKQAIRSGHEVVRHEEFLGNVLAKRDAELLDLYLDRDPSVVERMDHWSGVAYPRSPRLVRRLLARGLDPNRPDWQGKTPLHACAENADRSIAAIFLEAGANINARDVEFQATPLAAAVRSLAYGRPGSQPQFAERGRQMVEFLLKRGAATNLPGDEPWATPLAWARRHKLDDLESTLVAHGAR